jgi:hypothetical protein
MHRTLCHRVEFFNVSLTTYVRALRCNLDASSPAQTALTALFLVLVVVIGWAAVQGRTPSVVRVLSRTLHPSSQLPIRIVVLLLAAVLVSRLPLMGLNL